MTRVYIETYGCALSEFDSNIMAWSLESRGYQSATDPSAADVIILNTCAVRLDTEQRIVKRLTEIKELYPGKKLVVAGCLAKSRPGLIRRVVPTASLVSPQNSERVWVAVETEGPVIMLDGSRDTDRIPRLPVTDAYSTVMIQEGCLGKCSFCITKLARDRVSSYQPRVVIEAIRDLVSRGAREIRLTGQDTAAYGVDLTGRPMLPDLVSAILDKVDGDYKLRIGMMTPEMAQQIIDDLLPLYRDSRLYRFFHIPVQTGDDELLRVMGRGYTIKEFKAMIRRIKSYYPDALVATDIIVGHPGETENSFRMTLRLVEEMRFERVHIAQYTIRPRTKAAALRQVPDPVKKERSKRLVSVVERIGLEIHSKYHGLKLRVVITERGYREGSLVGRLGNYVPVVIPYRDGLIGRDAIVKITGYTPFDLRGSVVEVV